MSIPLSTIVRPAPTRLNRPIKIGTFGDSTATMGTMATDYLSAISAWGSSENYPINVVPMIANRPVLVVANGGIAGETTSQFISRSANVASATRRAITDIKELRPDVVLFQGGSINDCTGFTSSTPQATIDAVATRHIAIARSFISAGIPVLDPGIYGYNVAGVNLEAIRSAIVRINSLIKSASQGESLWRFVDVEGVISENGTYYASMTTDNVHLNANGGLALGGLYAPIIDAMFSGVYSYGTVKYDSEKAFATPSSGVPSSHSLSASGTLTVNSKASDGTKFTANVTTTATTELVALYLSNVINTVLTGALSGERYAVKFACELRQNGALVPCVFSGRVWLKDSAVTTEYIRSFGNALCNGAFNSLMSFVMPAAASACSNASNIYYGVTLPAPGTYDLTIYPEIIYKLP